MSATIAGKKQRQAAPAPTTGRGAALLITLGLVLLTMGCGWALSLLAAGDSAALQLFRRSAEGLAGPLCPGLILLALWGGAKLLVSARHRVSARNFFLTAALFWLALTVFTLSAYSRQGTPYLDSLLLQAGSNPSFSAQYSSFLRIAYQQGAQGAGGWLGMALAYPLWQGLTRIGSLLLAVLAMILLAMALLRLRPGRLTAAVSAWLQKNSEKRHEIQQQRQAEQAAWGQEETNAAPSTAMGYGAMPASAPSNAAQPPYTPPDYYQAAPIYAAQPAPSMPVQTPGPEEAGFYPVHADLYQEPFPLHAARDAAGNAAPASDSQQEEANLYPEIPPAAEAKPLRASRSRRAKDKNKADDPLQGSAIPPAQDALDADAELPSDPQQHDLQPQDPDTTRYERPAAVRPAAFLNPQGTQALDAEEDDPPWDVPSASPAAPAVPRQGRAARREKKPAAPPPAPDAIAAPEPQPESRTISASARPVKPAQEMPRHTTQKNEPQPVYTDPAVPITGERIPITPKRDQKDPAARLDGTSAPTVRQESAGWLVPYQAPPIRLLKESRHVPQADARQEDERRAQVIESTLRSFGVESEVKQIMHGPSITQFAIQIAPGVKVNRVANTADNLALELKTKHVRVESPIQDTNYIGIEVPNQIVSTVSLREVLESPEMRGKSSPLVVALGKNIAGAPVLCDLSKMPHLLIAGATGSGKSVCINSIVCSLLYRTTPKQVRMIMIDPKQVELSVYNTIPHLLVPVISDPRKAAGALAWVVQEMLERYGKFSDRQVRNLAGYNNLVQGTEDELPNIVVIIDEMADLMEVCRKDVEESIRRLAALARAAGIYMVLATQRPSVDVITGVVKNNIPSRIAFAVSSGTDSRTIIDINGAEKLMGKGDMLYKPTGASPVRVQGCFVSDEEVNAIAEYIGSRYQTDFDPNIVEHLDNAGKEASADDAADDYSLGGAGASGNEAEFSDLLQTAIEMAVEDGQTSTSMLQRRLRVGYARAGRLIDEMEKRGIISQSEGSKPRKTLITREQYDTMLQDN